MMLPTKIVGKVTTTGHLLCISCAADGELLLVHRMGALESNIVSPSLNGIVQRDDQQRLPKGSEHYGAPCANCGWEICEAHT